MIQTEQSHSNESANLRRQADATKELNREALQGQAVDPNGLSPKEVQHLVHELQACQAELELHREALREATLRCQMVVDFTYDWEYWENPDGTLRYISPACERITGYTTAQFITDPHLLDKLVLPEDKPTWAEHHHDVGEGPGLREIQFRIRRRDGETRWIEHACRPVADEHGAFLGFRATNRDITERKRAEKALHQQGRRLAVIEERQRLARELHDSVAQAIYTITLYGDAAIKALSAGRQEAVKGHLRDLRQTAQEALRDMRLLVFELRPPELEKTGLSAAIQSRLEAVEARAGLQTELHVEGEERLPLTVEEELYRIAQEALNNVVKHSRARQVSVRLRFADDVASLVVWDDGVGFDPALARSQGGMGLQSMKERAQRLTGALEIESAPGQGTRIKVQVDIRAQLETAELPELAQHARSQNEER